MHPHLYLHRDLPLIPDHVLLMARRAYYMALGDLRRARHAPPAEDLAELEEAVRRIDEELQARGIGAAPWWASNEATRSREAHPRPTREEPGDHPPSRGSPERTCGLQRTTER